MRFLTLLFAMIALSKSSTTGDDAKLQQDRVNWIKQMREVGMDRERIREIVIKAVGEVEARYLMKLAGV